MYVVGRRADRDSGLGLTMADGESNHYYEEGLEDALETAGAVEVEEEEDVVGTDRIVRLECKGKEELVADPL